MRRKLLLWTIPAVVVAVSVLTVALCRHGDAYRDSDIEIIGKYKHRYLSVDEEATEAALRLLHHPDLEIKREAITIISAAFRQGYTSAEKAVPELVRISRSDPDPQTRSHAASVLTQRGKKEGLEVLLEVATDSGAGEMRRAMALYSLRLAPPPARADDRTLGEIAHSLLRSADYDVRIQALYALPFTDDTVKMKEFMDCLVEHFVNPDSALLSARSNMLDAGITRYDDFTWAYQGGLYVFAKKEPDLVARLLGSSHEMVRALAAQALVNIRDQRGVLSLVELLRSSENWKIRLSAVDLLGQVRDTTAIPALKEALKDPYVMESALTPGYSCRPVAEGAYRTLKWSFHLPEEELGQDPAENHPSRRYGGGRP